MTERIKKQKIFLNAMDSWFSNFIIETFRTDHLPESKSQTEFMGTINDKNVQKLPMYFKPKIINIEFNTAYENILFSNDIFIYNLNTGTTKEIEYIINGLKSINNTTEKILIIISNIMTWSKTPEKLKSETNNDEIIFIHPDDIKKEEPKEEKEEEDNNEEENENEELKENNEENKENVEINNNNTKEEENVNDNNKEEKEPSKKDIDNILSTKTLSEKEEKEENKKVIVYYTDKDYLLRKPNAKYMQYKYIENEAILLNQKKNVKAYVICPGFIYGYGEKTFYSIFRSAILNLPIEEMLIEKGRNIIPTIHMKDLINIISKIIEKKPNNYYILAFDQNKNNSLLSIAKSIYECCGDINKMIPPKEEPNNDINNEENNNEENINNEENNKTEEINNNNNENNNNLNNNEENKNELENETSEKKNEENTNNNTTQEKKKISFFSDKKYILSKYFPRDLLYFDIKLLYSDFLKGEPKNYYNNESDEENNPQLKLREENIEYNPLFKWHAQHGIISNLHSIRKEFIKYRNLSTNTILILGNPYCGKTELSTILSKIFHIPLINVKIISDFGKSLAGLDNNNQISAINKALNNVYRRNSIEKDLIRDIKKYLKELEENKAIAEDNYNKRKDKKKTDPPFDDNMYYRFDDEMLIRILERRLQQNDTYIYGYILDGFPKSAEQAEQLMTEYEKIGSVPNSIIIFDNVEDEFLINRIKLGDNFPKDPKDPRASVILDRANRRLGKIKENKMQKEFIDLVDYFKNNEKYKDKILFLDTKKDIIDLVKESQEFILNHNDNIINKTDEILNCKEYIYDYIKEQEIKKQKEEEELLKQQEGNTNELKENENNPEIKEENKKEENNEQEEGNEVVEKKEENDEEKKEELIEEKSEKEEIIKSKEEIEKDNIFKLLEKKSEVLRRYLSENVLPLLSLGILQVATERPDDPVEALADFLLDKTLEIEKNEQIKKTDENKKENENNLNK